jgi:hypothetical protein
MCVCVSLSLYVYIIQNPNIIIFIETTSVSAGNSFHVNIGLTCPRAIGRFLNQKLYRASQGGYTANAGTDRHNQLWKTLFVTAHGNLVLRKVMMERNKNVVSWNSQTVHGRTGCRRCRRRDSADEQ